MICRLRLFVSMVRPAVVILLGLFAATGLAQAGQANNTVLLAKVLVVVVGFLVFSVVINDLSDEAIDRINLPDDLRRPLVAGTSSHRQFVVMGVTGGVVALATSALLRGPAVIVVIIGLALSAGYSLRPVRLADRGAAASLILPAGYVAVPYLVGVFAVHASVSVTDLVLLAGLYIGFIGRILLKDFRDVRGDALFGKRTFLVRHGRRPTCAFSAVCWVVGSLTLVGVRGLTPVLIAIYAVYVVVALTLLRSLSTDGGSRRDEALISAAALVGRGMILTLLGHFSIIGAHWSTPAYNAAIVAVAAMVVGSARTMAGRGPITRLTVPVDSKLPRSSSASNGAARP